MNSSNVIHYYLRIVPLEQIHHLTKESQLRFFNRLTVSAAVGSANNGEK